MTYAEAVRELGNKQCSCGSNKSVGFAFCWDCWRKLSEELQRGIYRHLYGGNRSNFGYEKTITRAKAYLTERGAELSGVRIGAAGDFADATDVRDESAAQGVQANHGL